VPPPFLKEGGGGFFLPAFPLFPKEVAGGDFNPSLSLFKKGEVKREFGKRGKRRKDL